MSQVFKVRVFNKRDDYRSVIKLISDIIVNEFKFKLEYDGLDSDLLKIEEHYSKADGGSFWVTERSSGNNKNNNNSPSQIVGTIAIRNLKQVESTCELKRMYVLKGFRQLGIGHRIESLFIFADCYLTRVAIMTSNTNMSTSFSTLYAFTVQKMAV